MVLVTKRIIFVILTVFDENVMFLIITKVQYWATSTSIIVSLFNSYQLFWKFSIWILKIEILAALNFLFIAVSTFKHSVRKTKTSNLIMIMCSFCFTGDFLLIHCPATADLIQRIYSFSSFYSLFDQHGISGTATKKFDDSFFRSMNIEQSATVSDISSLDLFSSLLLCLAIELEHQHHWTLSQLFFLHFFPLPYSHLILWRIIQSIKSCRLWHSLSMNKMSTTNFQTTWRIHCFVGKK